MDEHTKVAKLLGHLMSDGGKPSLPESASVCAAVLVPQASAGRNRPRLTARVAGAPSLERMARSRTRSV
jgi:hypothetical protein